MLKVDTQALEQAFWRMDSLYARISDCIDQLRLVQNRLAASSNVMDQSIGRLDQVKRDLQGMEQTILYLNKALNQCGELYCTAEKKAQGTTGEHHDSGTASVERQRFIQMHEFERLYEQLIEPLVVPNL